MITDLLTGTLSFGGTIALVAVIPLCAVSWARQRISGLLPAILPAALLVFAAVSGVTSRAWPFDIIGWVARMTLSCAAMTGLLTVWRSELESIGERSGNLLLGVPLVFGFLALIPSAYILLSQHWDGAIYIRSPFQLDPVRNTDIVAALTRGSNTIFLPNTQLVYQLLWYYGAADVFGLLPTPELTRWYTIQGMTLATAWLFNVAVLWSVVLFCDDRRRLWWILTFVFAVLAFDVSAWPVLDELGAADVAAFEYFSPLIMTLTAPQHTTCLTLLVVAAALYMRQREQVPPTKVAALANGRIALFSGAIIASPVLGAMFFPAYYAVRLAEEAFVRRHSVTRTCIEAALVLVAAVTLMPVLTHVPFLTFFLRGNAIEPAGSLTGVPAVHDPIIWAPFKVLGWLALPFLVSLVLLTACAATGRLQERLRPALALILAVLAGFFFWNYIFTDVELRRHFSIVAVSVIFVSSALTFMMTDRGLQPLLIATALITAVGSIGSGLWFIRDATVLPSTVATDLPLHDYFCINRYMREAHQRPKGVIAASGDGLVLSIINEEATTLAPRQAILVHQKTDAVLRRKLEASGSAKGSFDDMSPELLNTLRDLGFDSFVWGPVEERAWGAQKALFFSDAKRVFECGSVGFYRFSNVDPPHSSN